MCVAAAAGVSRIQQACQLLLSLWRDVHDAAAAIAPDPAPLQKRPVDCSAEHTGHMIAPLRPVETAAGERTTRAAEGGNVYSPGGEKRLSRWSQIELTISSWNEQALALECSSEVHRQLPRQM